MSHFIKPHDLHQKKYGGLNRIDNSSNVQLREKEESSQEISSPNWGKSMPGPLHIWVYSKWCSRYKCLIAVLFIFVVDSIKK